MSDDNRWESLTINLCGARTPLITRGDEARTSMDVLVSELRSRPPRGASDAIYTSRLYQREVNFFYTNEPLAIVNIFGRRVTKDDDVIVYVSFIVVNLSLIRR